MELERYLKERFAPSTVKRYLRELHLFFSTSTGNPKMATYQAIMAHIGRLRKAQKDVVPALHAIKAYHAYLVATGQRKDNPAKAIRLRDKKSRDIQLQELFSQKELERLLERKERYPILKNRNKFIISLLIYQALTNGDIKDLELKDIDLQERTAYVKGSRKTNSRTLKLQEQQLVWLKDYLENDRQSLLKGKKNPSKLFLTKLGTAENGEGIGYLLETCRHLFPNRRLNAKTIRQSVIANLLQEGKDLRLVQAFAGHKYPSTTERYRQGHVEALRSAIKKHHPLG